MTIKGFGTISEHDIGLTRVAGAQSDVGRVRIEIGVTVEVFQINARVSAVPIAHSQRTLVADSRRLPDVFTGVAMVVGHDRPMVAENLAADFRGGASYLEGTSPSSMYGYRRMAVERAADPGCLVTSTQTGGARSEVVVRAWHDRPRFRSKTTSHLTEVS